MKTFQSNTSNLLEKLTENIAEMKLEHEMTLINCQTDLLLVKFKQARLKTDHKFDFNNGSINVQKILQLSDNQEAPQTKLLALEQQNKFLEILHAESEKNLDMLQKEVILLRERLTEFDNLYDKYNLLKAQQEKNELEKSENANLMTNSITRDLVTSNEQLAMRPQQCHMLTEHVIDLTKKNKECITVIESESQRNLKTAGEEVSVPLSSEIDKHRCIINQLKEEILELVQKRHGHLDILNKTQHQQTVKSLELNLVKLDRRLQYSYAVIHKLKHQLHQERTHQNESGSNMQAEIAKLKWVNEERQHELDSLRAELLHSAGRITGNISNMKQ